MPLFPGHVYLGPGNTISNVQPVDRDDEIARTHDIAYENATSFEDIKTADWTAIKEFGKDLITTGNWHSLVGAAGLSIKAGAERILNRPIYPAMPGTKRKLSLAGSKQVKQIKKEPVTPGPSKPHGTQTVTAEEEEDIEMFEDLSETQLHQLMDVVDSSTSAAYSRVAGAGGGGTSTNLQTGNVLGAGPQLIRSAHPARGSVTYQRSRLMQTWGNGMQAFVVGSPQQKQAALRMATSLAYLPVELLSTYITYAEYESLPKGSYIKEVRVKVTPKGVRCSFDTAQTLTGSANTSQVIFAQTAIGLNHKVHVSNHLIERDTTHKMTITALKDITKTDLEEKWPQRLYGYPQKKPVIDNKTFLTDVPCSLGAIRAIPFYAAINITCPYDFNKYSHTSSGWPQMDTLVTTFNIMEHINMPCINYVYKPKNGYLATKDYHPVLTDTETHVYASTIDILPKKVQLVSTAAAMATEEAKLNIKVSDKAVSRPSFLSYYQPIEKGTFLTHIDHGSHFVKAQPSVHFGIMGVQSNVPNDTSADFVNACAVWQIDTEIDIAINTEYTHPWDRTAGNQEQLWGTAPDIVKLISLPTACGLPQQ